MRKLLISSVGMLSALLLVGSAVESAFADEAPRRAAPQRAQPQRQQQPQQQANNWNGGQAGGSNGASSANNNFVEPGAYNFFTCGVGPCFETPFAFSSHKTSYLIGGFLGYRWQLGGVVVGIEGDINFKKGETSYAQFTPTSYGSFDYFTGSQKQGTDGSFRGRLGFLITPWTLAYVTGGLAVGSVSGSFSYAGCQFVNCSSGGTNVFGSATWNDTRVGGTVGGGLEFMISQGWTIRTEYRYTDLGKYSKDVPLFNNNPGCPATVCGYNAHIDLKANNHRATVGLAFNL